eukprot:353927-Chlamydomonas_euryale.AAC.1
MGEGWEHVWGWARERASPAGALVKHTRMDVHAKRTRTDPARWACTCVRFRVRTQGCAATHGKKRIGCARMVCARMGCAATHGKAPAGRLPRCRHMVAFSMCAHRMGGAEQASARPAQTLRSCKSASTRASAVRHIGATCAHDTYATWAPQ